MKSRAGFTLIECLAALAFLAILMPVVMRAMTMSSRAGSLAERKGIAGQLAENQLNQVLVGNTWSGGESSGAFEKYPAYQWTLKRVDWPTGSGMSQLTMEVTFKVQGQAHSVQLSTLASQTLSQAQLAQ